MAPPGGTRAPRPRGSKLRDRYSHPVRAGPVPGPVDREPGGRAGRAPGAGRRRTGWREGGTGGSDALSGYHRKRDFDRTAEAEGGGRAAPGARPGFVVQIHDARTLHFEFRLEVDGVLKSWAVP